jgi:hypothetical protein
MIESPLTNLEFKLRELLILKSDAEYWAVTLWIASCYAIDEFDFAPRLAIYSPEKRCGKSLLLEVIANCLTNSRLTSSISASALFRTIEKDESLVVLIDEADTVFGRNSDPQKGEALRGVMNGGFKRGQVVTRCDGNSNEPKDFKIFCPVAVAGIGIDSIPETVRDRSVLIEMRRKLINEQITEFESDEVDEHFEPIRNALLLWRESKKGQFRSARPSMPKELNSRARDVWKPLFKLALVAGNEWLEKANQAALSINSGVDEADEVPLSVRLLIDIREVFQEETIPTAHLIERLKRLEESPWTYMYDKFNARTLAQMLKDYGIKPQHWRSHRGYERKDFQDAWNRYLPQQEPVTSVTSVTNSNGVIASDANDACDTNIQQNIQYLTEMIQKELISE